MYKHNKDEILRDLAMVAAKCKTTVQSLPPLKLINTSSELYLKHIYKIYTYSNK